jgi:hypothetical protein
LLFKIFLFFLSFTILKKKKKKKKKPKFNNLRIYNFFVIVRDHNSKEVLKPLHPSYAHDPSHWVNVTMLIRP